MLPNIRIRDDELLSLNDFAQSWWWTDPNYDLLPPEALATIRPFGLRGLEREGFRYVHVLQTPAEVETAVIERQPLWNNHRSDAGPFDIIGASGGCISPSRMARQGRWASRRSKIV